jgi:hypothetical protein
VIARRFNKEFFNKIGQKATSARQFGTSVPPPGTDILVTGSFAPGAAGEAWAVR